MSPEAPPGIRTLSSRAPKREREAGGQFDAEVANRFLEMMR